LNREAEAGRDLERVEEALRRWDPIGVLSGLGDDEGPMDEYDSHAPQILGLLQRGADVAGIERELVRIRTDRMELGDGAYDDRTIAEDLMRWWASWGGT
jgi:hypothetical protein